MEAPFSGAYGQLEKDLREINGLLAGDRAGERDRVWAAGSYGGLRPE